SRSNERTDHSLLHTDVANRPAVQPTQPEQKSCNLRIATQVTSILGEDKSAVILCIDESPIIDGTRLRGVVCQTIHYRSPAAVEEQCREHIALSSQISATVILNCCQYCIDKRVAIEAGGIPNQELSTLHQQIR